NPIITLPPAQNSSALANGSALHSSPLPDSSPRSRCHNSPPVAGGAHGRALRTRPGGVGCHSPLTRNTGTMNLESNQPMSAIESPPRAPHITIDGRGIAYIEGTHTKVMTIVQNKRAAR